MKIITSGFTLPQTDAGISGELSHQNPQSTTIAWLLFARSLTKSLFSWRTNASSRRSTMLHCGIKRVESGAKVRRWTRSAPLLVSLKHSAASWSLEARPTRGVHFLDPPLTYCSGGFRRNLVGADGPRLSVFRQEINGTGTRHG